MKVYVLKSNKAEEFNESKAKEAKVFEVESGYKTPVGIINAPLSKVLDFLCDLGYEVVYLFVENKLKQSTFEWETLNSVVNKVRLSKMSKECGAIVVFIGFVREVTYCDGKVCRVKSLKFEIYDKLYSKKIEEICKKIEGAYGVKVVMFHKVGELKPGEDIVYVVVMGKHRKEVWKAAIEAVELMKKDLPIWKKEIIEINGKIEERWV